MSHGFRFTPADDPQNFQAARKRTTADRSVTALAKITGIEPMACRLQPVCELPVSLKIRPDLTFRTPHSDHDGPPTDLQKQKTSLPYSGLRQTSLRYSLPNASPMSNFLFRLLTRTGPLALIASLSWGSSAFADHSPVGPIPSFRNDMMAVLSKAGCNLGTCHGNANGKGGFKLSLRGQHPELDFETLTRQVGSRRASIVQPDDSLLLQKPLMEVPHEGGRRFEVNSDEWRILRNWIAAGMPADDAEAPHLVALSVEPSQATVYAPETTASIRVTAEFTNGLTRDVTSLTVFESSSTFVEVSSDGIAEAEHAGLTTVTARYLDQQIPVRLEFVPERPDFAFTSPSPANFVDKLVFRQLERLKINPSALCDDTEFLRRAYLDLTGLLPEAAKAQQFVKSDDPNKRARLIDKLLDSPEFVDMQTLRWSDLLRVDEKTLDQKGVKAFHGWIRESFAQRKPLNQFAREIVAARGSTYEVPPTNFYRALRNPAARAESTAQVFLGIRLQCARCHNHPFDRWTQDDYYGWSNFFARIDYRIIENKRRDKNDKNEFIGEQIVLLKDKGDVKNPSTGEVAGLRYLGDLTSDAPAEDAASPASAGESDSAKADRLERLAEWLSSPGNERFAATQANRIWYQVMGRGIVDPIDDFRSTNPPVNPQLLESLTAEFVQHNFRVRHLMRVIMNSTVYQLSSTPNDTNVDDDLLFSRGIPRRLTAEQTLDAISMTLNVPIRFGGQQSGIRAVQLPAVRNGDYRYAKPEIGDRFLALFGKPSRLLSCECERTNNTTLAQTFEMVSGELIDQLLRSSSGRIAQAIEQNQSAEETIAALYWSALSRQPSTDELKAALQHVHDADDQRHGLEDVAWALLNSNEFLIRR